MLLLFSQSLPSITKTETVVTNCDNKCDNNNCDNNCIKHFDALKSVVLNLCGARTASVCEAIFDGARDFCDFVLLAEKILLVQNLIGKKKAKKLNYVLPFNIQ